MTKCTPCVANADSVNPEIGEAVILCERHLPPEYECQGCADECDTIPSIWDNPSGGRKEVQR